MYSVIMQRHLMSELHINGDPNAIVQLTAPIFFTIFQNWYQQLKFLPAAVLYDYPEGEIPEERMTLAKTKDSPSIHKKWRLHYTASFCP